MTATVAGIHLGINTHANRPAGNAVPDGSLYSCSDHLLVYKSNFAGNSWATWATLGGTGLADQGAFTYLDATEAAAPAIPATGKVRFYSKADGLLYSKDDAGVETLVSGGVGGGAGLTAADGPWWANWAAPSSPDAADSEFAGSDLSGWTRVFNSGASKGGWTERFGAAHFFLSTTGGNPELDAYAKARTMSVGDYVEISCAYQQAARNNAYLGAFVGLADGVTFNSAGSRVVGAWIHADAGAFLYPRALLNTCDGYNTRTTDGTIFDAAHSILSTIQAWRVKYEAANTFGLYYSVDGVNWQTVQTNYAKTMTPTHIVFGASMLLSPVVPGWLRIECVRVNS